MEQTPAFHPLDYASMIRRRVWWLITPVALALVAGLVLAIFLPRQYTSTAVLGISLPAMSGQVLSDHQRLTPQERTRNLNQVLLSPPVLERVAREEGLDRTSSLEDAVTMVGSSTQVRLPAPDPGVPPGSSEQFFVDFTHEDPGLAQRVANRLSEVFIEESSMKRTIRAEHTSTFLHEQLQASQNRLRELEVLRRDAREAHMGSLPEQTQSNLAMVGGLQQQLENTMNAHRTEQDRLQWIERQLTGARPTLDGEPTVPGAPVASAAAVRVATLERELAAARNIYTDRHPGLQRIERELAAARDEAAIEADQPEEARLATLKVDPAYRSLLADRDQSRLRIDELQRDQNTIRDRIAMYTNRVEAAPRVEQQVASLEREYELEKKQYGDLSARMRDAEMAEGVERSQGGERFALLARASYPSSPSSPDVPRLLVLTLLGGLCLGCALAFSREYLDRSIHDARALTDLELPVLGEIPRISQV